MAGIEEPKEMSDEDIKMKLKALEDCNALLKKSLKACTKYIDILSNLDAEQLETLKQPNKSMKPHDALEKSSTDLAVDSDKTMSGAQLPNESTDVEGSKNVSS